MVPPPLFVMKPNREEKGSSYRPSLQVARARRFTEGLFNLGALTPNSLLAWRLGHQSFSRGDLEADARGPRETRQRTPQRGGGRREHSPFFFLELHTFQGGRVDRNAGCLRKLGQGLVRLVRAPFEVAGSHQLLRQRLVLLETLGREPEPGRLLERFPTLLIRDDQDALPDEMDQLGILEAGLEGLVQRRRALEVDGHLGGIRNDRGVRVALQVGVVVRLEHEENHRKGHLPDQADVQLEDLPGALVEVLSSLGLPFLGKEGHAEQRRGQNGSHGYHLSTRFGRPERRTPNELRTPNSELPSPRPAPSAIVESFRECAANTRLRALRLWRPLRGLKISRDGRSLSSFSRLLIRRLWRRPSGIPHSKTRCGDAPIPPCPTSPGDSMRARIRISCVF